MDCTQVREELSALMDGELTPTRRTEVEAHLAQCSECLREAHALQQVDTLFHKLPKLETPPEFNETVHRIIQAENPDVPIRFERVHRMRMHMWPLLATAAILIVVIAAILPNIASQSRKQRLATVPATSTAFTATPEKAISETGASAVPVPPASTSVQEYEAEIYYSFDSIKTTEDANAAKNNVPSPDLIHAETNPTPQAAPVTNVPTTTHANVGGEKKNSAPAAAQLDINDDGDGESEIAKPLSAKKEKLTAPVQSQATLSPINKESDAAISKEGGTTLPQAELPAEVSNKAPETPAVSSGSPEIPPSPKCDGEMTDVGVEAGYGAIVINEIAKEHKVAPDITSKSEVKVEPNSAARSVPSPAPAPPVKAKISAAAPPTQRAKPQENERRIIEGVNFDYKEGVWLQEGYKGEKIDQLVPESEVWKALIKNNPKLSAFRQLGPKIIIKIAEKWYCIG